MSQVADAVALEVHDARARADASSVRAKEALARVAKARAGAARQRELAEDASRNMSADPDTVSEIRGQADSSTAHLFDVVDRVFKRAGASGVATAEERGEHEDDDEGREGTA